MALTDSRFVVIKSVFSGRYMHYTAEGDQRGYVHCAEKNVFDPYTKIEVERAKIDRKLVHLRFFQSNKYLAVCGPSATDKWIVASVNQPEEDRNNWSCTMFEPTVNDEGVLYLRHVQTGGRLATYDGNFRVYVEVSDRGDPARQCAFRFVDWDTLVILPKSLAFKGDNDMFLKSKWVEGYQYLEFSSADGNEEEASFEATMQPDGHIRFRSIHFDKFWRRSPNWIWADSTDTIGNDKDTLFWPVKVNDNTIALRNAGNNNFCKRLTTEGKTSCLNAAVSTITWEARLKVEELVVEADIYDVEFRMEDARIFDETVFIAGSAWAINHDPNSSSTIAIKISHQEATSSSFKYSLSLKAGFKTTFTVGIPLIVEGRIEVSGEITNSFEWNETTTETKTQEGTYTATVPPLTKVKINYVGTKGTCSVPFSYTKRERLSKDGTFVYSRHIDGIYVGVNCYNFHFEQVAEEPL